MTRRCDATSTLQVRPSSISERPAGPRKWRLGGWKAAVTLAAMTVAASILLWPQRRPSNPPSRADQLMARAPRVRDLSVPTPLRAAAHAYASTQDGHPSELDKNFENSTDYFAFVSSAAFSAYEGDSRAQYRIWEVLRFCRGELGVLKILGGGDVHKALQERLDSPYMTPAAKEQEAIRFKRCEGFSTGNAFASLPPRKGGYPKEYWLDRATQSGDGLAEVQALSVDLSQMGAPDDANAKLKASMETHEARALSSGDPAALMMLGTVLGNPSPLQDTDAAFALQVAACETGFDCSFSNPHFGYCLPDQDNCYKTGTYEGMLQQGYGAAGYARLYAKAQDIEDLLQRGEAGIVVGKYLAMK